VLIPSRFLVCPQGGLRLSASPSNVAANAAYSGVVPTYRSGALDQYFGSGEIVGFNCGTRGIREHMSIIR
jgi:hypothetical protein